MRKGKEQQKQQIRDEEWRVERERAYEKQDIKERVNFVKQNRETEKAERDTRNAFWFFARAGLAVAKTCSFDHSFGRRSWLLGQQVCKQSST